MASLPGWPLNRGMTCKWKWNPVCQASGPLQCRVTQAEIRDAFAQGWRVDSIDRADLEVTVRAEPVPSWLATITRT
jgi:hypothetical protein